ncbi:MAG: cobalamin-dependent protein [Polyangiaceae bacterium]
MSGADRPRVALLWPGGLFAGGANFGVPQLLMIARALQQRTGAQVDVIDLDMERAIGAVDLAKLFAPRYDVVGISCYSSYDYLKVMALAERIRTLQPQAWLVTGGYHASARPGDFTREDSPFDYVVVGDGENPMCRLVEDLARGKRPLQRVQGPDAVAHIQHLVPYDWELLARYRPVARSVASQAEIYLSRGCPFDCAFCMERAKRDVSWRPLDPLAAVEELHRLDRFLDLSRWTLFVADALFGMKRRWRREFLEALAAHPIRARKVWLLIRVDLMEREDIELMARANVSPGFGLESGDPEQLARIRKSGHLEDYLERMLAVASWAREHDVPFGANIIVGHPGETEGSMRRSAAYMKRLFLDPPRGTTGFLSVDPFRLYPGSPIDEERADWEARTGFRPHHYPWWEDGDQDFLSEWVDPSRELDFRQALRLRHELFAPIVRGIADRFCYGGPARDYYQRAVDEQVALMNPRRLLRTLGLYHLWRGLTGEVPAAERPTLLAADTELRAAARALREATLAATGLKCGDAVRQALLDVPRERFVELEDVPASAEDRALSLGEAGLSTISALHAYATSFDALALQAGDHLADLGAGTGYGSAVAAQIVGLEGRVTAVEWDAALAARAQTNLHDLTHVRFHCGDAHDTTLWDGANKVSLGFAVQHVPASFLDALPVGGRLVAPVGGDPQVLELYERTESGIERRELGKVRYVPDRHAHQPAADLT